MTYHIIFGSNMLKDCKGTFYIIKTESDEESIILKEQGNGEIFLNCILKDEEDNILAKVENSNVTKISEGYSLKKAGNVIQLINDSTNKIWLHFEKFAPDSYVLNGIFHFSGRKIIATDNYLKINGSTFSKNMISNATKFLELHQNGGISM